MRPVVFVLVLGMSSCSSLADTHYKGEAVATLAGDVRLEASLAPSHAQVALVWYATARSPDYVGGATVDVTGGFPATYSFDLYAAPDAIVLNRYGADDVGVALITAVESGRLHSALVDDEGDGFVGGAEDYLLVYTPRAISAGSWSESKFGPLSAGYHLLVADKCPRDDWDHPDDCDYDTLREVPLTTRVPVRLVDDASTLDFPEWT